MPQMAAIEEPVLQFLRDSVERIHSELESMGEDIAQRSRDLRALYSQRSKLPLGAYGYFNRFSAPLDALLVYLFNAGMKVDRDQAVRAILEGGYSGSTKNPERSLKDAIYYQTKPANNGKYRIKSSTDSAITLTESGKQEAKRLIALHGEA